MGTPESKYTALNPPLDIRKVEMQFTPKSLRKSTKSTGAAEAVASWWQCAGVGSGHRVAWMKRCYWSGNGWKYQNERLGSVLKEARNGPQVPVCWSGLGAGTEQPGVRYRWSVCGWDDRNERQRVEVGWERVPCSRGAEVPLPRMEMRASHWHSLSHSAIQSSIAPVQGQQHQSVQECAHTCASPTAATATAVAPLNEMPLERVCRRSHNQRTAEEYWKLGRETLRN